MFFYNFQLIMKNNVLEAFIIENDQHITPILIGFQHLTIEKIALFVSRKTNWDNLDCF